MKKSKNTAFHAGANRDVITAKMKCDSKSSLENKLLFEFALMCLRKLTVPCLTNVRWCRIIY